MSSAVICSSIHDLDPVVEAVLNAARDTKVVAFTGHLGAGKTTLIGKICAALDAGDFRGSPTFALVNEYAPRSGTPIFHFDCFRIANEEEMLDIGWEDYLSREGWIFIEWPEKIKNLLPEHFLWVDIKKLDGEKREIVWKML